MSSSVAASVFTLLITHLNERFAKERRALGALYGMAAEIELSKRCAEAYLESVSEGRSIWPPAYRVPTEFTSAGLPSLSGEGFFTEEQLSVCVAWYAAATELDRCLDSVANFVARDIEKN